MKESPHFIRQLLLFLCCFSLTICLAQNNTKIDSLVNQLVIGKADTLRVALYIELAEEYYMSAPNISIGYCLKAKTLADSLYYTNGQTVALGWLAYLYEQQGELKKALEYYQISLAIATKSGKKKAIGACLNNMAAIYKDLGNIPEAIRYHYKSLEIKFAINDIEGQGSSYNNLAFIYQSQGKIPLALDYFSKALKIFEKINDSDGIATTLNNLGNLYKQQKQYSEASAYIHKAFRIYKNQQNYYGEGYSLNALGGLYEEQNNLDAALGFYQKALQVRTKIDDKQGIAYTLKNIGNVYIKLNRKEDAKNHYLKSLQNFEEMGDKLGLTVVSDLYGTTLIAEGNAAGEVYLKKSLLLARELGYPENIRNAAYNLDALFRQKKQYKDALEMSDLYIQMRDSVENDKSRKAALQTQFKYEYEKKEAVLKSEQEKKDAISKAEIAKQKLMRNGFVAGFAIVLLFAGVVFRQRNRIFKEKQRSDELLLNILPQETAEELKSTGAAKAKDFDQVTILFTDFKNFTKVSEQKSAQELVNEINFCYSEFDKIVQRFGVEKIKTIGDAYMCAGGLPVANSTNAVDTICAALAIRDFMLAEKIKREAQGELFFEIRIGVHTGPVVAGIVGIKKFAYDIWGDAVNTASRMESSGEPGKVNISGSTYALIKDQFICTYRGKIEAKNKGEIDMYFVEGHQNASFVS